MQSGDGVKLNRRGLLGASALALGVASAAKAQEAASAIGPDGLPTAPQPYSQLGPTQVYSPPASRRAPPRPRPAPPPPPPPPAYASVPEGGVPTTPEPNWERVRAQWALDWSEIDLSAMLFASNPKPVRDAIDRHRAALDAHPVTYLERNNRLLQNEARNRAGRYWGLPGENIALVESTTSGVGLLYNGLGLRYGQEVLTTNQDYYVTHESLRLAALRGGGAMIRKIPLFDMVETATTDQIVGRIIGNITPATRVLALTWVHSSTGLKMPIRRIADALAPINAMRAPHEKVLFSVDGVHGFGVEDETLGSLGCDFLVAGCHKWLFGPRGTGVIMGTPYGWSRVEPTVPSFLAPNAYSAWLGGYDPGPTTGARMTPGGFKAFEQVWSLTEAFDFHMTIGKTHIRNRTHALAARLKEGLAGMPHVRLKTPRDPNLSAGIVAFDVDGMTADSVVHKLRAWKVIGSAAPYAQRHARLTPSMRNTEEDVDFALNAIAGMRRR